MITIKTTHYTKKDIMFLDEIFTKAIIKINKYCRLKCEDCKYKNICGDLSRTHLYLQRKIADMENKFTIY